MEEIEAIEAPYRFKSLYLFLVSFVVAFGLTLLLKEPGFTDSQVYVIFLLFFATGSAPVFLGKRISDSRVSCLDCLGHCWLFCGSFLCLKLL